MTQKLHIKTWGCQMNEYDSSKMADLLLSTHGLELTEIPEEADVLLLNTCSIREKAQEKVFHQLGRWKELKKNNIYIRRTMANMFPLLEKLHSRLRQSLNLDYFSLILSNDQVGGKLFLVLFHE